MRELSVRNIVRMWDTYLVRLLSPLFLLLTGVERAKVRIHSPSFTYMFAAHSSSNGRTS